MPTQRGVLGGSVWVSTCVAALACAPAALAQRSVHLTPVAGGPANGGSITAIAFEPGDDNILWIGTRSGGIYRFNIAARTRGPAMIQLPVESGGEGGLLGMTFAPDFATSGLVYVAYSLDHRDTSNIRPVVGEFRYDRANPDVLPLATERRIIDLGPSFLHNGGWIEFGRDGMLYISRGEGGNYREAQNLANFYGKILRIDVRGDDFPNDPARNYAIPAGNPFTAGPEIWLYGLRNPWRCSFDRETGDLWIGDVGERTAEELNLFRAGDAPGVNFGWPCFEGATRVRTTAPCVDPVGMTLPTVDLRRGAITTVIGGHVYRGEALPSLRGSYIFGSAYGQDVGVWTEGQFERINMNRPNLSLFTFAEDSRGELYATGFSNTVYRFDCVSDYNGDQVVDAFDFIDFFECFDGRCGMNRSADLTGDGVNDWADILMYFDFFERGC